MNTSEHTNTDNTLDAQVIIVGTGPAGLGVALVLKQLGIDFLMLEREQVGASFRRWPKESRLISPSFTGNFFNVPDLNAISPDTSPAFNLLTEHPLGKEYAEYLCVMADFYKLNIHENTNVESVTPTEDGFELVTNEDYYYSKYVIWAAGEFQYPRRKSFKGDEHCIHFAEVDSFTDLEGEEHIVIGGYESGFDASLNLVKAGKEALLFDGASYLELINSDSSYSLSPYTRDRLLHTQGRFTYFKKLRVDEVERKDTHYEVHTADGNRYISSQRPINCTGFESSISLVSELFEHNQGYPVINDFDESSITKNLFLVGPQVKHGDALFCFIYKFRQRFAIVAEEIATREDIPKDVIDPVLEVYKNRSFYLKDLTCCDGECAC